MATLVALIGAIITILGMAGLARPTAVMRWIDSFVRTPRGLYAAATVRLVGGAILVFAAPSTRFPPVIWAIGLFAILAAVGLLLAGFGRVRSLIDWWMKTSTAFLRMGFVVVVAFGGFLVYAGI
jgi:hypothetical protein